MSYPIMASFTFFCQRKYSARLFFLFLLATSYPIILFFWNSLIHSILVGIVISTVPTSSSCSTERGHPRHPLTRREPLSLTCFSLLALLGFAFMDSTCMEDRTGRRSFMIVMYPWIRTTLHYVIDSWVCFHHKHSFMRTLFLKFR